MKSKGVIELGMCKGRQVKESIREVTGEVNNVVSDRVLTVLSKKICLGGISARPSVRRQ